jgi:hypothetical protein
MNPSHSLILLFQGPEAILASRSQAGRGRKNMQRRRSLGMIPERAAEGFGRTCEALKIEV